MSFRHISVMPVEVLSCLNPRPGGIYVDCTLGGCGHTRSILEQSAPDGQVIGFDQDRDAIENAARVLAPYSGRVRIIHGNFADISDHLASIGILKVNGILADLGLSQNQLDGSGRGFSFKKEEPLDMRMNTDLAVTAGDIVHTYDEKALAKLIFDYGEERFAGRIARFIVAARQKGGIRTSRQLADIIAAAVPAKAAAKQKIHPATRTFQAFRIAVNRELEVLGQFLETAVDHLVPGGRICVLSFHSLEDRMVKTAFRNMAEPCVCPPRFPVCTCGRTPKIRLLGRKAVKPTEAEIAVNPMARSTRLRAAERCSS